MGEDHGRAKLSNHEIDLMQSLIECREALIEEYTKVGLPWGQITRELKKAQLSYGGIAWKFEVSKSHVRCVASGIIRSRAAFRFKRIEETCPV